MARSNQRILFIDGFAGPGEYLGGEDGSPVIALKAFIEHAHRQRMRSQVVFLFVEKERERADHLRTVIQPFLSDLGTQVRVDVMTGSFDETMSAVLGEIEQQRQQLAPSFVMVDPFGVSDTPMDVLERILRNEKSELYVSFMWEWFNRFRETDEFRPHLDSLFGTTEWRQLSTIPNWRDRKRAIFDLYRNELKRRGARYVVHFELYEGASLIYAIFFATKHPLGCDKMKEAIWAVDPFSGHAFRAGGRDSLDLFEQRDLLPLRNELRQRFAIEPVSVKALSSWIQTDATYFYSGQLKQALRELEGEGLLSVAEGSRQRVRTFPERAVVQFTPP